MGNLDSKDFHHEEFNLLRVGLSDQANILAEDELSELFGGYHCKPNCPENYVSCPSEYCGDYEDDEYI